MTSKIRLGIRLSLVWVIFITMTFVNISHAQESDCDDDAYCTETQLLAWFKTTEDGKWKDCSNSCRKLYKLEDECGDLVEYDEIPRSINYNPALYFGNTNAEFRLGSNLNNQLTIIAVLVPERRRKEALPDEDILKVLTEEWHVNLPELGPVVSLDVDEFQFDNPLEIKETVDYDWLEYPICDPPSPPAEGTGGSDLLVEDPNSPELKEYDFEKYGKIVSFFTILRQDRTFSINGIMGQIYNIYSDSPFAESRQKGLVPEFMVFNGFLTEQEKLKVETYLAIKYGISKELDYVRCLDDVEDNIVWDHCENIKYNYRKTGIAQEADWTLTQSRSNSYYDENISINTDVTSGRVNAYRHNEDYAHNRDRLITIGIEDESSDINHRFTNGTYHIWGDDNEDITRIKVHDDQRSFSMWGDHHEEDDPDQLLEWEFEVDEEFRYDHISRVWKIRENIWTAPENPSIRWLNFVNIDNERSAEEGLFKLYDIADYDIDYVDAKTEGYCASSTRIWNEGSMTFRIQSGIDNNNGTIIGFSDDNKTFTDPNGGTEYRGYLFGLRFHNNQVRIILDKEGTGDYGTEDGVLNLQYDVPYTLRYDRADDQTYIFEFIEENGETQAFHIDKVCIGNGDVYAKMHIRDDVSFSHIEGVNFENSPNQSTNVEFSFRDIADQWINGEEQLRELLPILLIDRGSPDEEFTFGNNIVIPGYYTTTPDEYHDKIEFTGVNWNDRDLFTLAFLYCPDPVVDINILNCCPPYDLEFTATSCLLDQRLRYVVIDNLTGNIVGAGDDFTTEQTGNPIDLHFALPPGDYTLEVYFGDRNCDPTPFPFTLDEVDFPEDLIPDEPLCIGECIDPLFAPDPEFTYQWIDPNGTVTTQFDNFCPTLPGVHTFKVLRHCVDDEVPCMESEDFIVEECCTYDVAFELTDECCECGLYDLHIYPNNASCDPFALADITISLEDGDCTFYDIPADGEDPFTLEGVCFQNNPYGYHYELQITDHELIEDYFSPIFNVAPTYDNEHLGPYPFQEGCVFDLEAYLPSGVGDLSDYTLSWFTTDTEDCSIINEQIFFSDTDSPFTGTPEEPCFEQAGCYYLEMERNCEITCPDDLAEDWSCINSFCVCFDKPECQLIVNECPIGDYTGYKIEFSVYAPGEDCEFTYTITGMNGVIFSGTANTNDPIVVTFFRPGTYVITIDFEDDCECEDIMETVVINDEGRQLVVNGDDNMTIDHYSSFVSNTLTPSVILGPLSYNDAEVSQPVLSNITNSTFDVALGEFQGSDGIHVDESIAYFSADPGVYDLDGLTMEAGNISGVTETWQWVYFTEPFEAVPVVIATQTSHEDPDAGVVVVHHIDETRFRVKILEEEIADNVRAGESVSFMAFEQGIGSINGQKIYVTKTGLEVDEDWFDVSFPNSEGEVYTSGSVPFFLEKPLLFSLPQRNIQEAAVVRYDALTYLGANVKMQEEQTADTETDHALTYMGIVAIEKTGGCDCLITINNVTITTTEASCGNADGTATVTVEGGTDPFYYDLGAGVQLLPTNGLIEDLAADDYNITITDSDNCTYETSFTISQPNLVAPVDTELKLYCASQIDLSNYFIGPSGGTYYDSACPGPSACPSNSISNIYGVTASGLYTFAYCIDDGQPCAPSCGDYETVLTNCNLDDTTFEGLNGNLCATNEDVYFEFDLSSECNLAMPFNYSSTTFSNNLGLAFTDTDLTPSGSGKIAVAYNSNDLQNLVGRTLEITAHLVLDYNGAIGYCTGTATGSYTIPVCCDCDVELVDNGDCTLTVNYTGTNCDDFELEVEKYENPGCDGTDCLLFFEDILDVNGGSFLIDDLQPYPSCDSYENDDTGYRAILYGQNGCNDVIDSCVDLMDCDCDCDIQLVDNGDCTLTVNYSGVNCNNYEIEVKKYENSGCSGSDCLLYSESNLSATGGSITISDLEAGSCSSLLNDTGYEASLVALGGCDDVMEDCLDITDCDCPCSDPTIPEIIWGTYPADLEVLIHGFIIDFCDGTEVNFSSTAANCGVFPDVALVQDGACSYSAGSGTVYSLSDFEALINSCLSNASCAGTSIEMIGNTGLKLLGNTCNCVNRVRVFISSYTGSNFCYQVAFDPFEAFAGGSFEACCSNSSLSNSIGSNEVQTSSTIDETFDGVSSNFSVFPNPARSQVTIQRNDELGGKYDLHLMDYTGRSILKVEEVDTENFVVDLQDIPGGLYLIGIRQENKSEIKKLIVGK